MYQFLRTTIILFMFFATPLSFGMNQALFEFEKASPELQCNIINRLDDPLTFGKTSKIMYALVKDEGERNLKRLYKTQDLDFAQSFLLSHYVPVILINNSNPFEKNAVDYFSVNAYAKSFYGYSTDQLLSKEVVQQQSKRFDEAIQQKRIQHKGSSVTSCLNYNDSLIKAVLFGSMQDLWKELNSNNGGKETIIRSVQAVLSYTPYNNNFLETLLLKLKKEQLIALENECGESGILRGLHSYQLLFLADRSKNKKAFEMLSEIDPYLTNKLVWRKSIIDRESKTTLDRMIENGTFDPENIEIFKKHGAITKQQAIEAGIMPRFKYSKSKFNEGWIRC